MTTSQIRDVSLYVEIVGQGYPLLLMHCGPGLDHTSLLPLQACVDERWAHKNAVDLLTKCGYSPAAVKAARRFYNGQITSGQFVSTVLQYINAYYDHRSFLEAL